MHKIWPCVCEGEVIFNELREILSSIHTRQLLAMLYDPKATSFLFVISWINALSRSEAYDSTQEKEKEIPTPILRFHGAPSLPRHVQKQLASSRNSALLDVANPRTLRNFNTAPTCLLSDKIPRTVVLLGLALAWGTLYPNPLLLFHGALPPVDSVA